MEHEVLTWAELTARTGSPARARTLLARAEWWRVCRGAYAPWYAEDGPDVRALALRRLLPPGVALSHRSALWLLGLDVLGDVLDVTAERGRQVDARPGLRAWEQAPSRAAGAADGARHAAPAPPRAAAGAGRPPRRLISGAVDQAPVAPGTGVSAATAA